MKNKDKDKRQKREKDIHGCKRRYFFKEISAVPKNCHENALVSQVAGKYNKSLAYI